MVESVSGKTCHIAQANKHSNTIKGKCLLFTIKRVATKDQTLMVMGSAH